MAARGDDEQNARAIAAEDRRHDGHIGEMRAAAVGIVQHDAVAGLQTTGIETQHRAHGLAHGTQVHGHVRRIGDEIAWRVDERAGEVEPLLDVHRVSGVLERRAHLLGDRHEEVVEDLEHDRIGFRAELLAARLGCRAREHEMAEVRDLRRPAFLDDVRPGRLDDDRGAVDGVTRPELRAVIERRVTPTCARMHAHFRNRPTISVACARGGPLDDRVAGTDRLYRHSLDDQIVALDGKAETRAMNLGEAPAKLVLRAVVDRQWLMRALIAHVHTPLDHDPIARDILAEHFLNGTSLEIGKRLGDSLGRALQRTLDLALAQRAHFREAHAISREHARIGMQQHARDAEHIGDGARVLTASPAKAVERVACHVVAALHRDFLDRIGHVLDGNAQEALSNLLRLIRRPARVIDLSGQALERLARSLDVQRLVATGTEHAREVIWLDLAEQDIAVGDRERTTAAIAGRAWIGARAFGAHLESAVLELQDGAAARRDRVNVHHGRAHPHARDLRLEGALELAVEVRDVGGRAAHVEANELFEAGHGARPHHADDATCRPREDRVLALEERGVDQPAIRLHELKAPAAAAIRTELVAHLIHVPAQHGREVGIRDGRIATRDELDERACCMARRNLAKAHFARDLRDALFVRWIAIRVHERDGNGADTCRIGRFQRRARRRLVERTDDLAPRAHALVHLGDAGIEYLRQPDMEIEKPRAVLVADAQEIGETLGDQQQRRIALALEQRVRRDCRAHADGIDETRRNRLACLQPEQIADALHGGVAITLGVLREHLVAEDFAVRPSRDDVRECAAAIDPELPHVGTLHSMLCMRAAANARS